MHLINKAQPGQSPPPEDRGSLNVVLAGFSFGLLAALLLPFLAPGATLPAPPTLWFIVGEALFIGGSLLRRHCFRVLGTFFTGSVTIQSDHRLVASGAYRLVRHPSYSAAFLLILGIALSSGNWLSVIVGLGLALPAYAYRAHVEEQALLRSIGEPYAQFMATRKRFIPLLW
jgi:protein-S-isoprenylcysteine O-methyltransferase Ste14